MQVTCRPSSRGLFALALAVIIITCTLGSLLVYQQDQTQRLLDVPAGRSLQELQLTAEPPEVSSQELAVPQGACQPQDHVLFLKTHKCGSSTVQNILMRRALNRGLNLVLPEKANYLGHPELFNPEKHIGVELRLPPDLKYDIFTHHSRFNPEMMRRVLPADTTRVTILREPASLFESLYNYYDLKQAYDSNTLLELLQNPIDSIKHTFESRARFAYRIGQNQMSFDLGLPKDKFNELAAVQELIDTMEREFHLVMLSEYMEVSLILLAELNCWPLEDVVFIKLNARPDKMKAELSAEHAQKLRELNSADSAIYAHFKEIFKSRVAAYGVPRMERALNKLLHLNQEAVRACVQVEVLPKENANQYPVIRYKVRAGAPESCNFLIMSELEFTSFLRKQQGARLATVRRLHDFMTSP